MFNTTKSSILRKRALEGFQHYATVAAYYGLQEHFDRLLILLCRQFVTLARDQGALYRAAQNAEFEEQRRAERAVLDAREQQEERDMAAFDADEDDEDDVDGTDNIGRSDMMDQRERNDRTTTEASLTGRHASVEQDETNGDVQREDMLFTSKSMMLLSCIATLTREHGHVVRHGWRKVAESILVLYEMDALPKDLSRMGWSLASQKEYKVGGRKEGDWSQDGDGELQYNNQEVGDAARRDVYEKQNVDEDDEDEDFDNGEGNNSGGGLFSTLASWVIGTSNDTSEEHDRK